MKILLADSFQYYIKSIRNLDSASETGLKIKHNSILELYFEIFLNEIESLIRRGLIKLYKQVETNEFSLKGKLILSRNIF
ncbi:5-methylcytosine restriction system specificity protein McrC [Chryseobacterium sp. 52]|uniref:5-methylcytosine restriction system specificity protein McrC n=1 Tax=Chryseobacterium sp. 52 TaxID=2035213 RepID=UPI000C17CDB2